MQLYLKVCVCFCMSVFYGGYFTVIYVCLSNGEVSSVWHFFILFSTEACRYRD